MSSESYRLLLDVNANSKKLQLRNWLSTNLHLVCLPSRAAIVIILWTFLVGLAFYVMVSVAVVLIFSHSQEQPTISISVYDSLPYAILALAMVFYPLSGYIADICCGRLKTVVISLCILLLCMLLVCFIEVMLLTDKLSIYYGSSFLRREGILGLILALVSLILFIISLVGYQANVIQLGVDQLFEASSHYLGLFIHYATWTFSVASLPLKALIPLLWCAQFVPAIKPTLFCIPLLIVILLIILLMISWWKRHWFYYEPGRENPYKTVFKIINFARKHKYPLRRSAFTYNDDNIPSRIDFAKERFGGPFSIEQVESVKTFLRILVILFTLGPVFFMEVPALQFVFPLFSLHILPYYNYFEMGVCTNERVWEIGSGSGFLTGLSTLALYPIYMWIIFYLPCLKTKKVFIRLQIGIVLFLLGIVCFLVTDAVGHSLHRNTLESNQTLSSCMFHVYRASNGTVMIYKPLNMHWSVLILPALLLGIAPLQVLTTAYEFIIAQSPQSMKGLLVGVLFAIRGLSQFLNSIIITAFSLNHTWLSVLANSRPLPIASCGFTYLFITSAVGLIGLILFSVAAKKYKYRARNEGLFRQQDVEEVYDRYITQAAVSDQSDEN